MGVLVAVNLINLGVWPKCRSQPEGDREELEVTLDRSRVNGKGNTLYEGFLLNVRGVA